MIGQDIEETVDGRFIIAQGVAPDRVLSLVDPQARHGHKTSAHGFDGYKGHIAADPDSEIITAAEVGPTNTGDAAMAEALLADLPAPSGPDAAPDHHARPAAERACQPAGSDAPAPTAYGDSAYGTGALLADLEERGVVAMLKVAPATAPDGRFTKDQFTIDLHAQTVTCPARLTVAIIPRRDGGGLARFGRACAVCPLASGCTSSRAGRTISIHPTRRCSPKPASGSGIPPGGPTTARTARRSNASWRICSAAGMEGGAPAYAGCCGSGRTGGYWPLRSTSPAWPCSACTANQVGGRWHRRSSNRGNRSKIPPTPQGPTTIADNLPRAIRSALVTPH